MRALVEVHSLEELDRVLALDTVELIGINNRNLETFETTLTTTEQLLQARRDRFQSRNFCVVSESGLNTAADLSRVAAAGAHGVLIGESLMRQADLGAAIALSQQRQLEENCQRAGLSIESRWSLNGTPAPNAE
jgi:indole-3-glycerol phosphate synthase